VVYDGINWIEISIDSYKIELILKTQSNWKPFDQTNGNL
jgi:hypothetical protein